MTFAETTYGDNITDASNILTNERGFRDGTALLPTASPLALSDKFNRASSDRVRQYVKAVHYPSPV